MKNVVVRLFLVFMILLCFTGAARTALAYPILQLYIDGATYDTTTESWSTSDSVFDLWIIGDVSRFGTIFEVKLSASFFGTGGTLKLTPKMTSLVTDPSLPPFVDPIPWSSGTGSNAPLPDHGIFNDPTLNHWDNYLLGDFDQTDSSIGDFMAAFPSTFDSTGQINVYEVAITGWDRVHFDAMDHTVMSVGPNGEEKIKQWVAPFSHDTSHVVPEPASLLLLGTGLLGLGLTSKRKRDQKTGGSWG